MSAVGETRQRLAAGWRAAAWPGRVLHAALRIGLVVLVLAVAGAAALSWRLSQGPLDITWLARRIDAALLPKGAAADLAIGDASIAWNGFRHGADGGLDVRLGKLRLVDAAGEPIARLETADATLSLLRLLELRVVPRRIALAGLRLRAVRAVDGAVTLDLGGLGNAGSDRQGANLNDVMAELRQPAGSDRNHGAVLQTLAQLQHVTIADAALQIDDRASAKIFRVDLAKLDLRRQGAGGVKGAASGQVADGAAVAALRLKADLLPGGGTHVEATLAPTEVGPIARSSPAIAALGAVKASVQARATLDLSAALAPRAATLHVAAGGGTVSVAGGTVSFETAKLDASGKWTGDSWRPAEIALQQVQLVLPSGHGAGSTTFDASGQATRSGGTITASVDLGFDHVDFADLATIWPAAWGGHVQPWLVQNITAGTAQKGAFKVKLTAPDSDPGKIVVVAAGGTMQGQDLTVHWLSPVPPLEHGQAQVTVIGPDEIDVFVPSAAQGPLAVKDGLIRFTGLSKKDQSMALTTDVQGTVADLLQLLRNKRLKLLSKRPLPIKSAGGTVTATLQVALPLKKELPADQVDIAAHGRLSALRLAGLAAGHDLDHGDIQFEVTQDGLKASGPATVAGIAGTVDVAMDFRAGPPTQVLQQASLTGQASAAQLTAAGVDTNGLITAGDVGLAASYSAQRGGAGQVDVKADLTPAGLLFAGWRKALGAAATASATIVLDDDKLAGIDHIDAHGPGLDVVGRAEMVDGRPLLLRLERIELGPTRAAGEIRFPARPGEPTRVRLSGAVLDLAGELASKSNSPAEGNGNWVADARFGRVELGKGRVLDGVTVHAEHDGSRLHVLQASSTGPAPIRASITPSGDGRHLSVRATNAGALLRALEGVDTLSGGTLSLDAQFDDRLSYSPLAGRLDLRDFAVQNAVTIGKLLQTLTIYGILDAMRGKGVQFTRLVLPFRYDRQQLHIGQTRAYSASLGLTALGWIDFARNLMDVRGTIVPAYAINSALGRIPLVGRLFSPEKGGGLLAVNYAVTGRASDPQVTVNPLSALTPGFLRGLFSVFR